MCRGLRLRNVVACLVGVVVALPVSSATAETLSNAAYRLTVTPANGGIHVVLFDKVMNCRWPMVRTSTPRQPQGHLSRSPSAPRMRRSRLPATSSRSAAIWQDLEIEQTFTLPADQPIMEERIVLHNKTNDVIALNAFEAGLTRRILDKQGRVLPELAAARMVAVPFRHRAIDPKGYFNDFSLHDLATLPGSESWETKDQATFSIPSRHRWSEAWALTIGNHTLGIFSFNQENMLFSVLSQVADGEGTWLRFGGAVMLQGEPAALTRIAPGGSVDLGTTRFETLEGGYPEAMYAYRAMLDEKGCRFPQDFNPPVHWEQLYDMPNAWEDRQHRYTKEIVEREAAKGRDYSCEALYLDPGWDSDFATFLWGEKWLGPRKQFIDEMRSKYGLKVSLHTPLASWMSHTGLSWGIGAVQTYPKEARRVAPLADDGDPVAVPALRDGRRNLALLPTAKANASSLFAAGKWPIHQTAHLNDGWYGNNASWIADRLPAWVEIDLGAEYEIGEIRLGNEHSRPVQRSGDHQADDSRRRRSTTPNRIAATGTPSPSTSGEPLLRGKVFRFPATTAR